LNVTVHASSFIAELDEPAVVSPHFPTALIVPLMPHPLQFIEVPALSHDFRDFYKCSNTGVMTGISTIPKRFYLVPNRVRN
jgi:hypothetical protein